MQRSISLSIFVCFPNVDSQDPSWGSSRSQIYSVHPVPQTPSHSQEGWGGSGGDAKRGREADSDWERFLGSLPGGADTQ